MTTKFFAAHSFVDNDVIGNACSESSPLKDTLGVMAAVLQA